MDRPERSLDRKGDEETKEEQVLRRRTHLQLRELGDIEGTTDLIAAQDIESDDRSEHQESAEEAVEQEFHCCRDPLTGAIATDEEVDRDQHRFEEDIEEEDIGRSEDTDHHRLKDEDQDVEGLGAPPAAFGLIPSGKDHDRDQDHGEEDEQE